MANSKVAQRAKISSRIRSKVSGTAVRPRLSVFRSNSEIYAQLIDDEASLTIASTSTRAKDFKREGNKVEQSKAVGIAIAALAKAKNIEAVVFDRGGFLYHGRVKAVADGAREGGLQF